MGMQQDVQISDESFQEAQANLEQARQEEESARSGLQDALMHQGGVQRSIERAGRMEAQTRLREDEAWRAAQEARRKAEDARRSGRGQGRWETEARRWETRVQELSHEVQRRETQARSHAQQAQTDATNMSHEHARMKRQSGQAERMGAEARARMVDAERKAKDARRKGQDAHNEARSLVDLDTEAQRWDDEVRRFATQVAGYMDEHKRGEREAVSIGERIQGLTVEVDERSQATQRYEQRLSALAESGRGGDFAVPPLVITGSATAYLKAVLDGMERLPGQMLRLNMGPDGGISLALDDAREEDRVVGCEGTGVVLVGFPMANGLLGRTLDARRSPEGAQLVIFP